MHQKKKISNKKNGLVFAVPTEHQAQAAVVHWAHQNEHKWPCLRLLYAVPNGAPKSEQQAGKMKREGLRAGVPDLCLPVSRGEHIGMYIEMKKPGKKQTPEQEKYGAGLAAEGNLVVVCEWAKDAIVWLSTYIQLERRALINVRPHVVLFD